MLGSIWPKASESGVFQLKSVVLIDDDPEFIAKISRLINHNKFNVVANTRSGREGIIAIEYFRPDFIIMDIMMPDNDGVTVLKYIREKYKSYNPLIYVITAMETPLIQKILSDFKVDFVSFKPIHEHEITNILELAILVEPKPSVDASILPQNPVDVISGVMNEFGIPDHLTGSEYIKTALIYMVDDPIMKRNVYSKVATVFETKYRTVLANINNAIKACIDSETYRAEFGDIKAEALLFLNHLATIARKCLRGSDND